MRVPENLASDGETVVTAVVVDPFGAEIESGERVKFRTTAGPTRAAGCRPVRVAVRPART
ncbi:hypothetical protein [Promicromonospora sp. NPDC057488]|uniref:hypothetical protein n=1 Tax=Promicromonospora sp. NPDC057488 TaxID=3346147 RepID=UPI00367136EC